jgi:hypothetical protein
MFHDKAPSANQVITKVWIATAQAGLGVWRHITDPSRPVESSIMQQKRFSTSWVTDPVIFGRIVDRKFIFNFRPPLFLVPLI